MGLGWDGLNKARRGWDELNKAGLMMIMIMIMI